MKLYRIVLAARRSDGSRYPDVFVLPRDEEGMDRYSRWQHEIESFAEVDRCGYDLGAGWNPARCGNPVPCPKHGNTVCAICGESATEACSWAGASFVCGAPLCTNHIGQHRHM